MDVAQFMTFGIGCGITTRWLCGWAIAGMRLMYSLVDSVCR